MACLYFLQPFVSFRQVVRWVAVGLWALCLASTPAWAQEDDIVIPDSDKGRAYEHYRDRNYERARKLIDNVVKNDGKSDPEAWYYRGLIYYAIVTSDERPESLKGTDPNVEAYRSYRRCIELDKRREFYDAIREDYFQMSVEFLNTGNDAFEAALNSNLESSYKRAASYFAAFLDMYSHLGSKQGALESSLGESAMDIPTIQFYAAQAYDRSGQLDKAEPLMADLAKKGYPEPQLYARLKEIYIAQNKKAEALEMLRKAQFRVRETPDVTLEYARMLAEERRFDEALKVATKAIDIDRTSGLPYTVLGEIYERMNDYNKAEANFKRGLASETDEFTANFRFGLYYLRRGEKEMAQAKANKKKEDEEEAKEHYRFALSYLEAANRINPRHQENLKRLYDLYTLLDNPRKAELIKERIKP